MGFFAKKAKEPAATVQFLHSQVGPMERTITQKLAEYFRDVPQVEEAFFARVQYGASHQSVALCVYGSPELDTAALLKGIGQVYTRVVNTEQPLHTIFLNPAQHVDIQKTCEAFYRSPALK